MKKAFITILASFFVTQGFAQTEEQQMSIIDKKCETIKKNISNYRKVEDKNDSMGYSWTYYNGDTLIMTMIMVYDRSNGKSIDKDVEWYFSDLKEIYGVQTWTDHVTGEIVDNEETYLNSDEHLIAWLKFDKPVDKNSQDFKEADAEVPGIAEHLRLMAKK